MNINTQARVEMRHILEGSAQLAQENAELRVLLKFYKDSHSKVDDENLELQEELSNQRKQHEVIVNKLTAASLEPQSKVPGSSMNSHENSSMPRSIIPWTGQFDDGSECDDMHATAMSSTSTSIQPAMGETASTGNRAGGVNPAPTAHQDNVKHGVGSFR